MTYTFGKRSRVETKANCLPSGDHAGLYVSPVAFVNCVMCLSATVITNNCSECLPVGSDANANDFPSGDQTGSRSSTLLSVMRVEFVPSGLMVKISLLP